MSKKSIQTRLAPAAIGTYSQAVQAGDLLYCSGQIPLDPETMTLVEGDIHQQVAQVLDNLKAVIEAAGGSLDEIVKITVYLVDLANFEVVNKGMANYFSAPYPARAAVEISALPKGAQVEMDAIAHIGA